MESDAERRRRTIVTISGGSLSGKSTLCKALVETGMFYELVSHTTRPPRPGEVNGIHYHFVDNNAFDEQRMIGETRVGDYRYGTSEDELLKWSWRTDGRMAIAVVDPVGAQFFKDYAEEEGYNLWRVWLNVSRDVQVMRWLERARKSENYGDDISRLYNIMVKEAGWADMVSWNRQFDSFDKDTESLVFNQLMNDLGLPGR